MKKSMLTIAALVAAMLAGGAFAQTKGEADPDQSKAVPVKKASADEKKAAKQVRRSTGAAKVKEGRAVEDRPTAAPVKATAEEKQAARAKRRATAADAVRKGQITSGEK